MNSKLITYYLLLITYLLARSAIPSKESGLICELTCSFEVTQKQRKVRSWGASAVDGFPVAGDWRWFPP